VYQGAAAEAQHTAIRSWQLLRPKVEILLASSDAGVKDAAALHGVRHLDKVSVNSLGTPLLSSILAEAEAASSAQVFVLVNADPLL
jgi:hypothetical protein